MKTTIRIIENLINGNISDAKKEAKKVSQINIEATCFGSFGMSEHKSRNTAAFLKGKLDFQSYCDTP